MGKKALNKSIIGATICALLISSCGTSSAIPTHTSTLTQVPDTTHTTLIDETEQLEEQAFFDEHGFVFLATNQDSAPVLAVSAEGEKLLPVLADDSDTQILETAVYMSPENKAFAVYTDENNLPDKAYFEEYTILFRNHYEDRVTMILISEGEVVEVARDVQWDTVLWAEYKDLIASYQPASAARLAKRNPYMGTHKATLSDAIEMATLLVSLTMCFSSLAFPPSAAFVAVSCASPFLKAVKLFSGEDLKIFDGPYRRSW